jgi:hypothetical protein
MKKITLAFALITFGVQAQTFPNPYCDVSDQGTDTEIISSIEIAGNLITNSDTLSILVDKSSEIVSLVTGEIFTLTVEGDTKGDFENNIVAFIDWNKNEILDDAGEIFELGMLTNSDGTDGISVTMDITVPANAVQGETRIRITKTYRDDDSEAIINPCAIEFDAFGMGVYPGYGQALDFTLQIGTLGLNDFKNNELSVYPNPAQNVLNIQYKSALNSVKIYNNAGQEVYSKNVNSNDLQLDVSTLDAGSYIVRLFADQGQHSYRIVKQ